MVGIVFYKFDNEGEKDPRVVNVRSWSGNDMNTLLGSLFDK